MKHTAIAAPKGTGEQTRAYSIISVKSLSDEDRVIRGVATTPTPDRVGDIVEPLGVRFRNPMPLLHQHDHRSPVGTVKFDKPTKDGISFEARLPKIEEPGLLKDRVDLAWAEVKAGLVRAVSIGFRILDDGYEIMRNGGLRFLKTEVLELSLVTVPANADATITTIKSIDSELRAASGLSEPKEILPASRGKSKPVDLRPKEATEMKTLSEQIAALEAKRAANAARMEEVMQKSIDEGRSTDADEQEEFDGLEAELQAIDAALKRFKTLERAKAASAKPVAKAAGETERSGSEYRVPGTVKVKENLAPGIRFARLARVKGLAQRHNVDVVRMAESLYPHDETIGNIVKAAVPAGSTETGNWAANLVGDETGVFADFVEYLRPQTILGKFGTNGVPSLRRVPFRTPLITQTSGGAGYWVGEGNAKPLTNFGFSRTTLEPLKVANICVVTEELLRDSSPSAETILRDSLAAALRERLDSDFIDPAKAVSAGISPASILNGITPTASAGDTADHIRIDAAALLQAYIDANNPPTSGVWIMPAGIAMTAGMMVNALGQLEFPGLTMNGGTFLGMPVITSEYMPTVTGGAYVALVNAQDIYMADDGGIDVDMSREASLQMDSAPTMTSDTPTATSVVSLWQTNSVGFRAERTINWMRRRADGVKVLSGVSWTTTAS